MSEMIERVTNAIIDAAGPTEVYDLLNDRGIAVVLARAAVEAMRTPTKEMLDAVTPVGIPGPRTYQVECKQFWEQMADAALKEPQTA